MYGRMAETADKYMKKGQMVYVEGRLQTREWEDKDQVKRRTTEIQCDNFTMLGRRGDDQYQGNNPNKGQDKDKSLSDDDLPF